MNFDKRFVLLSIVFAILMAADASAADNQWHIKCFGADGHTMDVKAIGADGIKYDIKAMKAQSPDLLDIKAILPKGGGKPSHQGCSLQRS